MFNETAGKNYFEKSRGVVTSSLYFLWDMIGIYFHNIQKNVSFVEVKEMEETANLFHNTLLKDTM